MYIHEAIMALTKMKPCIRRRAWEYPTNSPRIGVKLQPTNSPDGCIVISGTEKTLRHGWQPTAQDLMAEDWEVVGL